jgi:hypothetical protein
MENIYNNVMELGQSPGNDSQNFGFMYHFQEGNDLMKGNILDFITGFFNFCGT